MSLHLVLGVLGVAVVLVVDAWLVSRFLGAYRKSRRGAHLHLAAGIVASFCAVCGATVLFVALGDPRVEGGPLWAPARWAGFVGSAASYGAVTTFVAAAFRPRSMVARAASLALAAGGVAVAITAVLVEPAHVATPATAGWGLRIPFVLLALAGPAWGALEARALHADYRAAQRSGREVNEVALARMRVFGWGCAAMAAGELGVLGFAPGGAIDTPLGVACGALIMLGALAFSLACMAGWATPAWLRRRWEARR